MGNGPRPSHFMMTSERKNQHTEDKRVIQGCIARVTERIRNVRELGNDFVTKGGLKAMTVREFIVIINHIVKQINPKANLTANYSDELHKFLVQMEYPFSVNKSWFKTPNAPHSINHIVVMLDFLLDYLPWEEDSQYTHDYDALSRTAKGEDFPSAEYTHHFRQQLRDMYHLWDTANESEAKFKQELKTDLIKAKSNGEFKGPSELIAAIAKQEKDIAAIVPVQPMDERQITSLEQALVTKSTELNAIIQLNKETGMKNQRQLKELRDLEGENKVLVEEEDRLKKIINRQNKERIRQNFEEMTQELAKLQAALQGKQTFIDRLSQGHFNKMLHHTKNVDKKADLLSTLTLKLMDLKGVDEVRDVLQLDDMNALDSVPELERLKQQLSSFSSTVLNNRRQEIEGIEKQVNDLNNFKIAYQDGVLQKSQARLQELDVEYGRVQSRMVQVTLGQEKYYGQLHDSIRQLQLGIEEQQRVEGANRNEAEKLEVDTQNILAVTRQKIAYIMEERQKNYAEFKQEMRGLNEAMRKLRDA